MIPPIIVKIFGKDGLSATLSGAVNSIGKVGKKLTMSGKKLTAGITLPLGIAAAASFSMANDFNAAMANVGTLIPGDLDRLNFLKKEVQALAIETGKSTSDVADGLFQVISAFGDGPETMSKLRTNARAAVGGVAGVADAINLTALVTKAYGDTSEIATQKVLDLAFNANKLGQTTFPEMAASLGQAIPMSKALGVSLETVFGVMGTFTGVTGNTSDVTTQLTSVLSALIKPTAEMEKLFDALGVSGGEALIKKFGGLRQAMKAIDIYAKRNDVSLGKLLGQKEALNLVLASTGAQAETFTEKLAAMNNVSGLAEEAFKQQAEGINKNGFAFAQFTQKLAITGQKIGDVIGTALIPFLEKLSGVLDFVQKLSPSTQRLILVIAALASALGPVLLILGALPKLLSGASIAMTGITLVAKGLASAFIFTSTAVKILALGFKLLFLSNPVGLIVLGVIALGAAIIAVTKNWDALVSGFKSAGKAVQKIFGGGPDTQAYGNARLNAVTGRPNAAIENQARNAQGTQINNAKVQVEFANLPEGAKVKQKDPKGVLNFSNGLMTAGM